MADMTTGHLYSRVNHGDEVARLWIRITYLGSEARMVKTVQQNGIRS